MTKYIVTLTDDERLSLSTLVSAGKAAVKRITRARILLKADAADGGPRWPDTDIVSALDIGVRTVERVRERFVEQGLDQGVESREALERAVQAWLLERNERCVGVNGQCATEDARIKLKRLYPVIQH